ncbi:MAG TPA: TonB-dependent receptor [Pseudomonadales bacterium]|nr:TonB-dependent receptor [Pseudomonadales bacterium]
MTASRGALATAIAIASLPAVPTYAQDGASGVEEVVVTGSRINRSNVNSPQPISTISSDDIMKSGQPDLAEILNDNPALLSTVSSSNSVDSAPNNVGEASNVGGSALDLRGLGYERTLTLVNGRRHVSGVEGTSSVDISTIPSGLIERVEVLTGGASAVYGADAVTGVVNFILKEDFEGFELDLSPGISSESDAESWRASALWGRNFANGRGNIVVAVQGDYDKGLRQGDRSFFDEDGPTNDDFNPARRFQGGDIVAGDTPNFAQFYDFGTTGLFPVGLRIPDADSFAADYEAEFGTAPTLTDAELALISRAANAPPRAILPGRTFNITSPYGTIALGDFGLETPLGSEPDLDGNGVTDCLQSFTGYNSSLDGAGSFGAAGGCWVIDAAGTVVPAEDGLVAGNFNQFGASQSYIAPERPYVIPANERYSINVNGRFAMTDKAELFWESKYVYQETKFGGGGHNFTDLLLGRPDNPFLPEELAAFANNAGVGFVGEGGLRMSRDSDDWGANISTNERETYRVVVGIRGDFEELGLNYEISGNYGKFERKLIDPEEMIADRFFAAIDAVTDPATGEAVCRSDLDASAFPATTPFDIFSFVGGGTPSSFFTFTPGDGQCQPMNIWGGKGAMSQESIDFVTYTRGIDEEITQTVFNAFVAGDTAKYFNLPAGPVSFAFGAEYREEESSQTYGALDQGILPVSGVTQDGIPFSAGDYVGDISDAASLGGTPSVALISSAADYDVYDVFAEVSVPLLSGKPFAEELTVDAAFRRADYSTFGSNETYSYGGVWSPVSDIMFRASYARAVRVPNLFELFAPDQGAFFRPADPCDAGQIENGADPALRQANCVAALQAINVPNENIFDAQGEYAFQDPLSAGFPGVSGGNSNLDPESADTITFGFTFQPRWIEGLSMSLDYWDIEIEDAVVALSSQNIVDGCYDAPSLNNSFCALQARNDTPTSAQAGGLNFLRQTRVNFGAVETAGYDMTLNYSFEAFQSNWALSLLATKTDKLDLIQPGGAPGEPEVVDPELGEMRRPEYSGQIGLDFIHGPFSLSWQTMYQDEQTLSYEDGVEIETARQNYGDNAFTDAFFVHDLNGSWQFNEQILFYGGVQNLTNEEPFRTEFGYPVSSRGRYFFAGVNWTM